MEPNPIVQTAPAAIKGKYGWHACSYEVFCVIRQLHKHWYPAMRQWHRWNRWQRKLPHNRVQRRKLRNAAGDKIGTEVLGPAPEPKTHPVFVKDGVLQLRYLTDLYRQVRRPYERPELVPHLGLDVAKLKAKLAEVEAAEK